MNFKNSEFLMLVAAFLVGYFFQEMMKGCQVMEGLEESITGSDSKNIVAEVVTEEASSVEDLAKAELKKLQTNYVDGLSGCMNLQTTRLTGGQYDEINVKNCLDELCSKDIIPPPAATTCQKPGDRCYDGGACGQRYCGYAEGRESISENDPGSEKLQGPLGCNTG